MSNNPSDSRKKWKGYVICSVAVLILSIDSLLIRKVSALSNYTVMFWRFFFCWLSCLGCIGIESRQGTISRLLKSNLITFAAAALMCCSNICFVISIQVGDVASSLVIIAANPIFAAIFSYIVFQEVLKRRTVVAILVSKKYNFQCNIVASWLPA